MTRRKLYARIAQAGYFVGALAFALGLMLWTALAALGCAQVPAEPAPLPSGDPTIYRPTAPIRYPEPR